MDACLAVCSAPAYLDANADGIKRNWPRVPLPSMGTLLDSSAKLGERLASLLDPDIPVLGVTTSVREELTVIGNLCLVDSKPLDPETDLKLTKGWGHRAGQGVNPGKGKVKLRHYSDSELKAIEMGAANLGLTKEDVLARLGERTYDVFLNDHAYWCNIPSRVWEFYVGGYQVIKKWLSYREWRITGRPLTVEEVDHIRDTARRVAAVLLLSFELDSNYEVIKKSTYNGSSSNGGKGKTN